MLLRNSYTLNDNGYSALRSGYIILLYCYIILYCHLTNTMPWGKENVPLKHLMLSDTTEDFHLPHAINKYIQWVDKSKKRSWSLYWSRSKKYPCNAMIKRDSKWCLARFRPLPSLAIREEQSPTFNLTVLSFFLS